MTCTWSHRKESRRGKKALTSDLNSSYFPRSYSLHDLGHFLYTNSCQRSALKLHWYMDSAWRYLEGKDSYRFLIAVVKKHGLKSGGTQVRQSLQKPCAPEGWQDTKRQPGFSSRSSNPLLESLHKNSVKKGKVGVGGRKQT